MKPGNAAQVVISPRGTTWTDSPISRPLHCKPGDMAFITNNAASAGKIVFVRERGMDFEGSPTWLVVAQGAPFQVRLYDGSVESTNEWWAVDSVLTPIRPGGDDLAERAVEPEPVRQRQAKRTAKTLQAAKPQRPGRLCAEHVISWDGKP